MKRISGIIALTALAACHSTDIHLSTGGGSEIETKASAPQQLPESAPDTTTAPTNGAVSTMSFTQDPHPGESRLGLVVRLYAPETDVAAIKSNKAEFLSQQTICEPAEREGFELTTRVLLRRENENSSIWVRYALRRAQPNASYTLDFLRVVRLSHADQSETTLWQAADGKPLTISDTAKANVGDATEFKVLFMYDTNNQKLCQRKDESIATLRNSAASLQNAKLTVKALDTLEVEARAQVNSPYRYENSLEFVFQKGKVLVPQTSEVRADDAACRLNFMAPSDEPAKGLSIAKDTQIEFKRGEVASSNSTKVPPSAKRTTGVTAVEYTNGDFSEKKGGLASLRCTGEDVILSDVQAAFDAVFGYGKVLVTAEQ